MPAPRKYPAELRERAIRLVFEIRTESGEQRGAISKVANQLGLNIETLRKWVNQAEIDEGPRLGLSGDERRHMRELEKENRRAAPGERDTEVSSDFLRGGARPPTAEVTAYIDAHRERFGVEPICKTLQFAPSTYYDHKSRPPSLRALRDSELSGKIVETHKRNRSVYGVRKLWQALVREDIDVGRDHVGRLMKNLGLTGVIGGTKKRTTIPDPRAERPADLVDRNFRASEPNRLWVADITYSAQFPIMCSCCSDPLLSRWFSVRRTAHNQRCSRKAKRRSFGRNRTGPGLGSVSRWSVASLVARSASRY
jgi:putative transposase